VRQRARYSTLLSPSHYFLSDLMENTTVKKYLKVPLRVLIGVHFQGQPHTLPHVTLVKEYVNCVSMPEYGLDCQSRRSKSFVVNGGALSTEVLRVAIWVPKYKPEVSCSVFCLEVKNGLRTAPTGCRDHNLLRCKA
jgi:hypothetical protein